MAALRDRLRRHAVVGDVRGLGLMIGVEIVRDRFRREPAPELRERILEEAFRRGLLLLGCGRSTIRLAPPLIVDEEDAAMAARILEEAVIAGLSAQPARVVLSTQARSSRSTAASVSPVRVAAASSAAAGGAERRTRTRGTRPPSWYR